MNEDRPVEVLCRYRLKPGMEQQFEPMLKGHWQLLHDLGLTSPEPARLQRASDKAGNVAYIERFAWKNADAVDSAHESPEVMRMWEPMGSLCDDMEFWDVEEIG